MPPIPDDPYTSFEDKLSRAQLASICRAHRARRESSKELIELIFGELVGEFGCSEGRLMEMILDLQCVLDGGEFREVIKKYGLWTGLVSGKEAILKAREEG